MIPALYDHDPTHCYNKYMTIELNRRFCVAPMLDCTDKHARFLHRLISRETVLYTEMITTGAILHGDKEHLLGFNDAEHPVALQLGGSDPAAMAQCAEIAQQYGYDEVNINVGCPSDRVQSGSFGACLMQQPDLVADNVRQMQSVVDIPVTVKSRIGVDDQVPEHALWQFVEAVANAGCRVFVIHARKAWLQGLSPKQNRDVPPLDYPLVYRLKEDFPELEIIINGGITTLKDAQSHLQQVDGVMMGREVYANPFIMSDVDHLIYGLPSSELTREQVLTHFLTYVQTQLDKGERLNRLSRHVVGLYHGQPRSRLWRRYLSENAHLPGADVDVIKHAREVMDVEFSTVKFANC